MSNEDKLGLLEQITGKVERQLPLPINFITFENTFRADLFRGEEVIDQQIGHNLVTTEGKNHILDVTFGNATPVTQVDPWYISLIDGATTPTILEADTLASHSGWTELAPGTDWTGNRLAWDDADAASGAKTASATTDFPILTTKTVAGILIASVATGTAGVLWAAGLFAANIPVVNGDTLKVTYNISMP